MVIGNRPEIAASLFAPAYTMAAVIANEFAEATGELYVSALIEVALVLFGITIVVNALARLLIARMTQPRRSVRGMTADRTAAGASSSGSCSAPPSLATSRHARRAASSCSATSPGRAPRRCRSSFFTHLPAARRRDRRRHGERHRRAASSCSCARRSSGRPDRLPRRRLPRGVRPRRARRPASASPPTC